MKANTVSTVAVLSISILALTIVSIAAMVTGSTLSAGSGETYLRIESGRADEML